MTTGLCAGVDVGGTKIQAVVTDGEGAVLGRARRATPSSGGATEVAKDVSIAVSEAATAAGVRVAELAGVGVGAPGSVDADAGVVVKVPNIEGWDGPFALGPVLSERLGVPVVVGNDVNAAVEAERRFGAGRGAQSFLGVFWGTGVGGGLVLDGRLRARARLGGRDRPRLREARRAALQLRAPRLRRGLRRPGRARGPRPARGAEAQDGPLRPPAGTGEGEPDERRLAAGARGSRSRRPGAPRRGRRRRSGSQSARR